MTTLRSRILALLALVPLLIGAVIVLLGMTVDRSWSAAGEESPAGAPVAAAPGGADAAQIAQAQKAAANASAQAGMLSTGTGQLAEGTGKLREGAGELGGGVREAQDGASQLAEGMRQLQAATGQLGGGATELADGVGGAVDQVVGLGAVQGQLLEAVDNLDRELAASSDPRAGELRGQLGDFRRQVENVDFGGEITSQLTRLKDGSRELANQLAVPGYGYHDGIYQATEGAKQLDQGLGQLGGGVDEAVNGVNQLDDGAKRVDGMAATNKDRVNDVRRALPATQAAASAQGAEATGEEAATGSSLAPVYALLIGALAALGGLAAGLMYLARSREAWLVGAGTVLSAAALFWVLSGAGVVAVLAAAGILALLTAASAAVALVGVVALGRTVAAPLLVVAAVVQVGLVGWVWKTAASSDPTIVWQAVSGLTPLHWGTGALTAAGNGADATVAWTGAAILAAVLVLAWLAIGSARREPAYVGGAGVHASREGGRYYRKSADASEGEFDGEIDDAARDDVAADGAVGGARGAVAEDYDADGLAEEYDEIEGDPVEGEVSYIGDGYIDAERDGAEPVDPPTDPEGFPAPGADSADAADGAVDEATGDSVDETVHGATAAAEPRRGRRRRSLRRWFRR